MKNAIKVLGIIVLVAIIGFAFITCDNGDNNNNNGNDPRPETPEAMSTKTALQYFTDEGIKIGINAGNSLDAVDTWTNPSKPTAVETAWGNPKLNQAYFTGLKTFGFNIVRIPVTWNGHIGSAPNYKIEEAYLKRVAEVVGYAKTAGLKAFINIHHDGHHDFDGWLDINKAVAGDTTVTDKFEKVWQQIAEYFINYGDWLMFQGFNEIHDGSWKENGTQAEYNVINNWNQKFTDVVRSTGGNNAQRYLLYYGYMVSTEIAETSALFKLPTDTATGRQIVGFHFYAPWSFAGEASDYNWSTEAADKANFDSTFGKMKTKFVNNNIPVIIGELGPAGYANWSGNTGYNSANVATAHTKRLAYIDYLFGKARENGIVPFYWENGSYDTATAGEGDFTLINRNNGQAKNTNCAQVIQHMIDAVNNATPPVITPGSKTITLNPNVYDAGDGQGSVAHGYQAKVSISELTGGSIQVANGNTFTLTYTFTSNVAIGNLQVVLVDTRSAVSYWKELSGYVDIGAVTVGTPVSGNKIITATATAGDSSVEANQFIFSIGETDSTASAPTLTFTALTLVKN